MLARGTRTVYVEAIGLGRLLRRLEAQGVESFELDDRVEDSGIAHAKSCGDSQEPNWMARAVPHPWPRLVVPVGRRH